MQPFLEHSIMLLIDLFCVNSGITILPVPYIVSVDLLVMRAKSQTSSSLIINVQWSLDSNEFGPGYTALIELSTNIPRHFIYRQ